MTASTLRGDTCGRKSAGRVARMCYRHSRLDWMPRSWGARYEHARGVVRACRQVAAGREQNNINLLYLPDKSSWLFEDLNPSQLKLLFPAILKLQIHRRRKLPPAAWLGGHQEIVAPDMHFHRPKSWHWNPTQFFIIYRYSSQPFRLADPMQPDFIRTPGIGVYLQRLDFRGNPVQGQITKRPADAIDR